MIRLDNGWNQIKRISRKVKNKKTACLCAVAVLDGT